MWSALDALTIKYHVPLDGWQQGWISCPRVQVKIRGFRIELGEIDTFLGHHPDVRENKTLVMRDRNEEKQIISFFVPEDVGWL
jgi:hypothetical protein